MRTNFAHLEECRLRTGPCATDESYGRNGAFRLVALSGRVLLVIASDGSDWRSEGLFGQPWEHVSVHAVGQNGQPKTPTWNEMCEVKALFFDPQEIVLQFHPAERDYVNVHAHTLHLWRPTETAVPMPPLECV